MAASQWSFHDHDAPLQSVEFTSFPKFPDGDVHICLSPSVTYQLHASILRQHSPLLKDMLHDESAVKLSAQARREGVTTLYRIDLLTPEECKNRKDPLPDNHGVGSIWLRVSANLLSVDTIGWRLILPA